LVVCPKCGSEVVNPPEKSWTIPSREELKADTPQRLVGIYSCPNCGVRFRSTVESETILSEPKKIEKPVEEPISLGAEPVPKHVNIGDKISAMETERLMLMEEIGSLKKMLSREGVDTGPRFKLSRKNS